MTDKDFPANINRYVKFTALCYACSGLGKDSNYKTCKDCEGEGKIIEWRLRDAKSNSSQSAIPLAENRPYVEVRGRKIHTETGFRGGLGLDLRGQQISKISEIEGFEKIPHLTKLDLSRNKISTISDLDSLTDLKILNLENNQISNTQGMETLVNLTQLDLNTNKINKIAGLESLVDLKFLNLSYNNLSTIHGLRNLILLGSLSIDHNHIRKIEGLSTLANLTILSLSHNNISSMRGLEQELNLEDLHLGHNQIKEILDIRHLLTGGLLRLDLEHNQITSIAPWVEQIQYLRQVRERWERLGGFYVFWPRLDVTGNPIPEDEIYSAQSRFGCIYFE